MVLTDLRIYPFQLAEGDPSIKTPGFKDDLEMERSQVRTRVSGLP